MRDLKITFRSLPSESSIFRNGRANDNNQLCWELMLATVYFPGYAMFKARTTFSCIILDYYLLLTEEAADP